jgi:hypothetical protein
MVANTKDHFAQLSSGEIATPHEVRLSACRAGLCNDVEKLVRIDPTSIPEYPERPLDIPIKGIVVDAGTKVDDFYDSKRNITDSELEAELVDITNKELGCNGLRIYGSYDSEVLRYAEIAARGNYDAILLCPRYVSQDTDEVVRRTVDFAAGAEALRSTSKPIVLQIGQELSTDVSGIFEGRTWLDRVFEVGDKWHKHGWQQKLNQLLNDLAAGVSGVFHDRRVTRLGHGNLTFHGISWMSTSSDATNTGTKDAPNKITLTDSGKQVGTANQCTTPSSAHVRTKARGIMAVPASRMLKAKSTAKRHRLSTCNATWI